MTRIELEIVPKSYKIVEKQKNIEILFEYVKKYINRKKNQY